MSLELKTLLPCPFCGKPGSIDEERSLANPDKIVFVPSCSDPDCIAVLCGCFNRRAEAIAAWNTRATSALTEQNERLRKALEAADDMLSAAKLEYEFCNDEADYHRLNASWQGNLIEIRAAIAPQENTNG